MRSVGFWSGLPRWCGLIALAAMAGCATPPEDPDARAEFEAANDPLESLNRSIFAFNLGLDRAVLRPVAIGYRTVIPGPGRSMVRNFLDNLEAPVILANDVLQGSPDRAGVTLTRFIMNSTLGIGGLLDPATTVGLSQHDEDFGQTLGVWGVDAGPYFMLPVLGPSPPRETVGLVVDYFLDPVAYILDNQDAEWLSYVRFGVRAVDSRSSLIETLDEIERTSIDFYATIRSLYRQRRMDEIRNGEPSEMPMMLEITFEDGDGVDKLSSATE